MRITKLEKMAAPDVGLADRLLEAPLSEERLNNTPKILPSKAELEAIASRNPDSLAARLARLDLRTGAYADE